MKSSSRRTTKRGRGASIPAHAGERELGLSSSTQRPRVEPRSTDPPATSSVQEANAVDSTSASPAPQTSSLALCHPRQRTDERPFHDPIYRIMHRLPRSDVLEIVKCKFGKEHCERAAGYFDASFMQNPLRRLKLQVGCSGPGGLYLFFPKVFFHRFALRTLDLSRNKLSASDVVTLCEGLGLSGSREEANRPSSMSSEHRSSSLELLDLSYNLGIGNAGAVHLLRALSHNTTIRAVQLISVSIDDDGAQQLAPLLRQRPRPPALADGTAASVVYHQGYAAVSERRPYTFLLNLNHNVIGAPGTVALGKGLPSHVSVTLCQQRLKGCDNPLAKRRRHHKRKEPRAAG